MSLITILTTNFPELKFISQTNSIPKSNLIDDGNIYQHELKLLYLPQSSEKDSFITLLHTQHLDTKSYIDKELMKRFEKELLIQMIYSVETGGKNITNSGRVIYSFADIRKKLKLQ